MKRIRHPERLLKLARLLREDADNPMGIKFDYDHWGIIGNRTQPLSCGTRACAMGFAAICGKFERAGLSFERSRFWDIKFVWKGAKIDAIDAAQELFGIGLDDAKWLFILRAGGMTYNEGAKAERHVARKIERFVTKYRDAEAK